MSHTVEGDTDEGDTAEGVTHYREQCCPRKATDKARGSCVSASHIPRGMEYRALPGDRALGALPSFLSQLPVEAKASV